MSALLTHFTEGLKSLRLLGPPQIPINPMTLEEEVFAMANNSVEFKEFRGVIARNSDKDQSDQQIF